MVQPKFEQDITAAGIARTRESVESAAAAQMADVRRVVESAEDLVDEVPGCRANGTCGRCVKFLQGGEGGPTLCARKLRVGRRNTRNGRNIRVLEVGSGA